MDEFALIRRYFQRDTVGPGVRIGIGDDGAVVTPAANREQVVVIDTLVEGVHFPAHFNPADIAYRAVSVNCSDIAAMGGAPRWMTLALSLPAVNEEWLASFAEGLFAAATEYGVELIGGDTTRADSLVVTVQVTGELEPGTAIARSGAAPGDAIYVTGTLGDAAGGLRGLNNGNPVQALLMRFARPSARVTYAQALNGIASAAIDVSDGLAGDLRKLLQASGVGAEIDIAELPLSTALRDAFGDVVARDLALYGGDDYELCFTATGELPDPGIMQVTRIGTVVAGADIEFRFDGDIVPVDTSGYVHFDEQDDA